MGRKANTEPDKASVASEPVPSTSKVGSHLPNALGIGLFLGLLALALYSGELDHAIMSMLFFGGAVMIWRRQGDPPRKVDLEGRLIGVARS